MYRILELLENFNHKKAVLNVAESLVVDLAYDTRKIYNGREALFFALCRQRDGHVYIAEAYDKGVRNFVVSKVDLDISDFLDSNFIWVDNTLTALQEIATFHRSHFSYPVIGITGSNGKTIVKEWLYQLLKPDYNCYQSPKSYNSQLGVALSLWNLNNNVELAIIEAGISQVGEMDKLAKMIQPTIGVFTNLGTAHREGFDSKESKRLEKWKLFEKSKVVIVPSAYSLSTIDSGISTISWGYSKHDFVHIKHLTIRLNETLVQAVVSGEVVEFVIPFIDQASIENALTCFAVMCYLGYDTEIIVARIATLKPLEMRLKLKRGKNNSSIIDDTYSNDLASLQIALDFLNQQNQYNSKKLILSDFEGESWTNRFENKILELIENAQLDNLFLVGTRWFALQNQFPQAQLFSNTADLLNELPQIDFRNSTVLIKGARKYQLEKVSKALVEQSHETVLEINLKALEHNIQQYRSKLAPGVKMMAMVKAFSYGSGSFEVANILQFNKIDYLTVAFVDEGVALRKAGISLPIMVLSPHESTFEDLIAYNLEPEIYSLRVLTSFERFLEESDLRSYPIHIKLDTGMHRLGFMSEEIDELISNLKQHDTVRVVSIFSHLVGAGDPKFLSFTNEQIDLFSDTASRIERSLGYTVLKHICNTSGITHHKEAHFDMVRLGIGLYGFDMSPKELNLEEVSQLKTTITQIKNLKKGETVGYDRKGVLERDSVIATVKIGYADGYNRRFGNGVGRMLINGNMVSTIGNICMDMCMLDITAVEAREGDEVLVFEDVAKAAKDIGTIPYELLTGVSSRVKRVYFYE